MNLSFGFDTKNTNLKISNTEIKKATIDFQKFIFDEKYLKNEWQMNSIERIPIIYFLEKIKPEISIEIGTQYGGSLKPISDYSRHVYTFDLCHNVIDQSFYNNVEFITGNSRETVPKIIKKLNHSEKHLEFVLIDGDHSSEGVKTDIENILKYEPKKPLSILMHDSFNPSVRSGILEADWSKSPYVHFVDVDFIHGTVFKKVTYGSKMWGGLALAILLPENRKCNLSVSRSQEFLFKSATLLLT